MALTFRSELPASVLQPLLDALLNQIPEDESSGVPVITVKQDSMPSSPAHPSKAANNQPVYDPAVVYVLEFCTALALRDDKTIELLGKKVSEALQAVIRDSSRYHPILVSRAAYYQFNILNASYVSVIRRPLESHHPSDRICQQHDFVRAPVLLHTVSSWKKDTLAKTAPLVLEGLKLCISQPGPLRSEIMTSPDFWVLLRTLAANSGSAPVVFEILEGGVSGSPSAIIADNYEAAIALLNEFATAAKVGAVAEQKNSAGDKRPRSARPPKKEAPRYVPWHLSQHRTTTILTRLGSENAVVARGVKAVNMIYDMIARIPHLMKQSHLESSEGRLCAVHP